MAARPTAGASSAAELLFTALDADGDGVITRDEMRAGLQDQSPPRGSTTSVPTGAARARGTGTPMASYAAGTPMASYAAGDDGGAGSSFRHPPAPGRYDERPSMSVLPPGAGNVSMAGVTSTTLPSGLPSGHARTLESIASGTGNMLAKERLAEQDVLLEARRGTEAKMLGEAKQLLSLLDAAVLDAQRLDDELSHREQDETVKRERAQGFCRTSVEFLEALASDAGQHSVGVAARLRAALAADAAAALAEQTDGDSEAQHAEAQHAVVAAAQLAGAVREAVFELHRSVAARCGENMGAMGTVKAAHGECTATLVSDAESGAKAAAAAVGTLAAGAKAGVQAAATRSVESLSRLAASGTVVTAAQLVHATSLDAVHAALTEGMTDHSQVITAQAATASAAVAALADHLDEVRKESDLGEADHIEQQLQTQRGLVQAALDSTRAIAPGSVAHVETLQEWRTASSETAEAALGALAGQREDLEKSKAGHEAACAGARTALDGHATAVTALGAAQAASSAKQLAHAAALGDGIRASCSKLRDGKLSSRHAANLSAAQKRSDESLAAQLDLISTLSTGLEAAITMDLTASSTAGAGEALLEDEILEANKAATTALGTETDVLIESLEQQGQQLGEVVRNLDVLTVTTREARQREALTNVMAEIQNALKKAQREAITAVAAGVDALLKEQMMKMSDSLEQKTKFAVQEQLEKLAREQQAQLEAMQRGE